MPDASHVRQADVPSLVQRTHAGDEEAHNQLTRLFRAEVHAYLASQWYPDHSDRDQEAEDLTQRVFVKLPRTLDGYSEEGKFPAWLNRVARSQYRTRCRTLINRGWETLHTMAGGIPADDPGTLFGTRKAELRKLVERLPEGERLVWNLWVQGFKHEQIAEQLGITTGASEVRLFRAKKKLTKWLLGGQEKS